MSSIFEKAITGIIILSVTSLFIAIFINFIIDDKKNPVKSGKRSIVDTGTMFAYFLCYYIVLRLRIGIFHIENSGLHYTVISIGALMVAAGAFINISGRLRLKNNWANQIKIYENQTLVNTGVYSIVRHPLYASIMLMFFGGSLVYRNWLTVLMTSFIFIPFMYYRAKQEEILLKQEFSEYSEYQKRVGMFFPKTGGYKHG